MTISYDDRTEQPASTASNQGYQLLDRHFPKDTVINEFLLVQSRTDMRTAKGLADLDALASRVAQLPGVTRVSGVTRPTGNRLDQAQLSWQNGQIGDKMAGAVADGEAHKDDLAKLTKLAGTAVSMAGFTAVNSDLQQLLAADFTRLATAALVVVGVVLIRLLRAVVAPLYLLGTVVLNYFAALGLGVLVFQYGFGHAIAWPVPLLAFILLIAVGADYNMLVISRLREESVGNMRVGVLRTVISTGSVITSAGLIFAASMFGLMIGSLDMMIQAGFVIGCGLLLDTFVVRALTVPAIATLLRERSWWPHRTSGS
jgi:uncharacterized membrane protein YdfJ with MMPL/SSD domain